MPDEEFMEVTLKALAEGKICPIEITIDLANAQFAKPYAEVFDGECQDTGIRE